WQQLIDYMVEDEYLGGVVDPEIEGRINDLNEGAELPDEDGTFEFSVMHMNDTHGRVENYPYMISAIDAFRGENPDSMLVHAGDVFSGTLYFNEYKGLADLALLNLMDIDVMTFGNHEFDLGAEENGHESLSEFVKEANFPFLGTNIDFSQDPFMNELETNESVVDDPEDGLIYSSIVQEINGEKVGIFGVTIEDTENISSPMEVDFTDFIKAAEEAVQAFEDAGINKIMAVNHLGFDTAPEVGNDMRVAMEVDGIDIIVGGHSHSEIDEPFVVTHDDEGNEKEPTVIVQGGQYANNLGTLTVEFDENGIVLSQMGQLLDIGEYEADEEALNVLSEYKERVDEIANEETGAVAVEALENPRFGEGDEMSVRADETRLGNLITDAMLAKAQEKFPETVIAFQNGGGIRAGIDQGPITVGEVLTVLPFGNNPVVAELSGQEIKEIMEHSVRQAPEENGGFLHVSGMKFYYDSTREPGDRIVEMYIDQDGELTEIAMDEMYLVTTNGFTGQGGDGYETFAQAFEEGRVRDIGEED
ncbi:bifunctional metallophosphatase/5'-nucleotidase, partial [Alkalibacterium putridalgicola]